MPDAPGKDCTTHNRPRIVTIDGPAGVGKSTLAKRVAQALGVPFMDTGAMFRAIGVKALAVPEAAAALAKGDGKAMLAAIGPLAFSMQGAGAATVLLCNGQALGEEIRSEQVGMTAARIATMPAVRDFLKLAQQDMGAATALVAEGRDMGTVVFPAARHKIFLDANAEERARRRYLQLGEAGQAPVFEKLVQDMKARDEQDRNRAVAPLRPADDAFIIDTSHIDLDGVFEAIMREVAE